MSSPRIPLVLPVRFSYAVHAVQTTSQAISTEGAWIRCLEAPPLETEVKLRIYLPSSSAVAEFTARVERIIEGAESGFWAVFTSAEPNSRERLSALISAHEGGPWRTPVPLGALFPRLLDAKEPPLPLPAPSPASLAIAEPLAEASNGTGPSSPGSGSNEGLNRRGFPRHRARFLVRFESVQEFVLQYAANISAGGVFISTDFPPAMDSVITVVLELPGQPAPVTARAQVVHRVTPEQAVAAKTEAGAGVQFIDADDAFRAGIDAAIEYILAENLKG